MRLLCVLLGVLFSNALAQTDSGAITPSISFGTIDTIIIVGNEKTKDIVILREMSLKQGMEATSEAMEFDKGRVYSTGLFTRVDMSVFPIQGKNTLLVDLNERWYIIPLPLFGFRDNDPAKAYYGAGLLHNNFRGLNQKLFGSIVFGYNPSVAVSFPIRCSTEPMISRLAFQPPTRKSETEANVLERTQQPTSMNDITISSFHSESALPSMKTSASLSDTK